MKIVKLILIVFCLCMVGLVHSQTVNKRLPVPHLLHDEDGHIRILADTVKIEMYLAMDRNPLHKTRVYRFNNTDRVDTVFFSNGSDEGYNILKYSDENQLLSISNYTPNKEDSEVPGTECLIREYAYGEDGQMLKMKEYQYFEYIGKDMVTVDTTFIYRYAMTDSSYICNDSIECILDNQGRVTNLKNLNRTGEYVFDLEGRKYRDGDIYYSYFDGGYTALIYVKIEPEPGLIGGLFHDGWWKKDYYIQENGYLSKKVVHFMDRDLRNKEWNEYTREEYSYHYKSTTPGSSQIIEDQAAKIYSTDGGIVIEAEKAAMVQVFSFDGQMIAQQFVSVGRNRIALSKGIYVVSIHGDGYKVTVK